MPFEHRVAIAAIVLGLFIFCIWVPSRRRRLKVERQAYDEQQRVQNEKRVKESVEGLMVELAETGRTLLGRLETKTALLQELLAQADKSIARLEALEARRSEGGREPVSPSKPDPTGHHSSRHAEIFSLAAQGFSHEDIVAKTGRPSGEVELILGLKRPTPNP
ncbi:MAG: hypothetical protein AB7F75_00290 [Planctomycetota bacterium]